MEAVSGRAKLDELAGDFLRLAILVHGRSYRAHPAQRRRFLATFNRSEKGCIM